MKKIIFLFVLTLYISNLNAQPLFTEDFEAYEGFGTVLSSAWPLSGFRVYINHGNNGSKGCGSNFNNNHKSDSLTSPDLGFTMGNLLVNFNARLATDFIGNTATAGYLPVANDHVWFLSSVDNGPYQLVEELTSQFTSSAPNFSNISVSVPNSVANSMRLKIKVAKAQSVSGTDFYLDVDNFSISSLASSKSRSNADFSINLLPNPNSGISTLVLGDGWSSKTQVEVFNILGNKVGQTVSGNGRFAIDLSNEMAGVYLVRVSDGKISMVKRMIVK